MAALLFPLRARDVAGTLEGIARELPNLPLGDALKLVYLYAEKDSPKYEAAARRWLGRYLDERSPSLLDFAQMAAKLTERPPA